MRIVTLIRPEALNQPRQVHGIERSQTREVKELPRCCAERVTRYYNDGSGSDFQCNMRARYEIDGRPLCPRHAGEVALAHLLKGSDHD